VTKKPETASAVTVVLTTVVFIIFMMVVTPWITIGAMNRFFNLSIEHNFWNYFYFWTLYTIARIPLTIKSN